MHVCGWSSPLCSLLSLPPAAPPLPSAHHCSLLSGEWSGKSVRVDGVETYWSSLQLHWDAQTGQVKGEGVSLWQGESHPFEVLGAFSAQLNQVEMLKSHGRGAGTVTHLAFTLDLPTATLTGVFAGGGSCVLQRTQGGANNGAAFAGGPHMQRSVSGVSSTSSGVAAAAAAVGGGAIPDPPKDLATFLSLSFPENPSVAAKIHSTLLANEIHEAESLTTFGADEWRELGIVLGHRSKIKLQLQRFFPHLAGKAGDEAGAATGAAMPASLSPSSSAISGGDVGAQQGQGPQQGANAPYHLQQSQSAGGYGEPQYGGPPPQQYQPQYQGPSQGPYAQGPGALSYGSALPPLQQQQAMPAAPLEFLCPITHEVMDDPVVAADGHSYERASVAHWLEQKKTSPITGKILPSKALNTNFTLRNAIANWKQQFQLK